MTHEKNQEKNQGSQVLINAKREKFCQLYVTSPFNLPVIYRDSGYKSKSEVNATANAFRLLREDSVRQRIKWLQDQRNARLGLDGDNVIRGLYEARDKCVGGVIVRDRQGRPVTEMVDLGDGKVEMCIVYKMDVAGFTRISEILAKYHGLLTDKVDITDNRVREEKIEELADDIIAGLQQSSSLRRSIGGAKKKKATTITAYPVDEDGKVDTVVPEVIQVNSDVIPEA